MSAVPEQPLSLDEVRERWPTLRQSLLGKMDDCALSTLFSLRYENGWSTHPQARGTIFHRVCSEALREMQRNDSEAIPVDVALAILEEKLRQRDVAPEDRVRVPLRELRDLRMAVTKWAADNTFSIRNVIDVERRLSARVSYRVPETGELVEREITGQLDALVARGEDEAVVIDWKDTWALPPERDEDAADPGVSYHGYWQQQFYALLVMDTFPSINAVVLREFYGRRSKARAARVTREDLPEVRNRITLVVEALDMALAAGPPAKLTVDILEKHGHWKPSPGKHCFWCTKAQLCPLDDDYKDGGIRTPDDAARAAAVRQVARSVDKRMTELCKPWVDLHGPIPVKRAKGRLVLGYRKIKGGVRFEEFTPDDADRPATEHAYDPNSPLTQAMKDSVAEAREQRRAL